MEKHYKINIRLINDDRMELVVKGSDIATLAKDLKGPQITFIPNKEVDFKSFTIFSHTIKHISYKAVSITPFNNPLIYEAISL